MTAVSLNSGSSGIEQPGSTRLLRRIMPYIGYTVLIIAALTQIVPFVLSVANSFKCLPAVNAAPAVFIPAPPFFVQCRGEDGSPLSATATTNGATFNPALEGYENVFAADLGRWLFNTAFIALTIMLLRLLFDSLAGYALARIKFPGNRLMFTIILGTMMIPGVVLLIPRFIILKQLGMLNAYQGIIIPLMADAFGIFLMKQFFESIPNEIEEAGQVDGANRLVMFFRIILPMATPALTALAIFSFQGIWNNFLDVLIVLGGNQNLWTLPLGLSFLRGSSGETLIWNEFLAGSVITTLPMAIIFFAFQRYFVEGVNYSGLAGPVESFVNRPFEPPDIRNVRLPLNRRETG
ncbi:MAG: carbohydrate ABC transporter permease [Chloroflexi bacterium]|nr:carbohydrate ABC transporter permease [Chloroflexota bacterium]